MGRLIYKIATLEARSIIAYADFCDGYAFNLNRAKTISCFSAHDEATQDENALFYQMMYLLNNQFTQPDVSEKDIVIEDLYDAVIYIDFGNIFEMNRGSSNTVRQNKAEAMLGENGITIDLGTGPKQFVAFERSGSMSRNSKLSFIRKDLKDTLTERITVGLVPGHSCDLSKLYAYRGLMLSSGHRIEYDKLWQAGHIVVIDSPSVTVNNVNIITVESNGTSIPRQYNRVEKTADIETTQFDGEGLITPELADIIDRQLDIKSKNGLSSYQIRMPFIKGMLHRVNFKALLKEAKIEFVRDIWGVDRNLDDIDIILTKSQFKGYKWLAGKEAKYWLDFLDTCRKYKHSLYISGYDKIKSPAYTELNYQLLNTSAIPQNLFRPDNLPDGWSVSPETVNRYWLTKATEQKYYNLKYDKQKRIEYFTDKAESWHFGHKSRSYYLAKLLEKNPDFIYEKYFEKILDDECEKILINYSLGKLTVPGDNRYFVADLMELLYYIVNSCVKHTNATVSLSEEILKECLSDDEIFAPATNYEKQNFYTLLRNPHIAKNEEATVHSIKTVGRIREKYLSGLTYTIMVSTRSLLAERLGGADFDGDMVRTIADPIYNNCSSLFNLYVQQANLPLLKIPSEEPKKLDPDNRSDCIEIIKNTFSSRVGIISNAALNRSIIAYDENTKTEEKDFLRKETETLAILTGLEIDSVKSGIKPDLSAFVGKNSAAKSKFLTYKEMVEGRFDRKPWYEPTFKELTDEFFNTTDWKNVTSNLEKLPLYAKNLKDNTPAFQHKDIPDSELFSFAKRKNWENIFVSKPPEGAAEKIHEIAKDYYTAINNIRAFRHIEAGFPLKRNVNRVLFMKDKENVYDADELYAPFISLTADRISDLFSSMKAIRWERLCKADRITFLNTYLPEKEFDPYRDYLCDFSNCGYKTLHDIVIDVMNNNDSLDMQKLHRENESIYTRRFIDAYINKPVGTDYRDAVSDEARKLIAELKFIPTYTALKGLIEYLTVNTNLQKNDRTMLRSFMFDVLYKELYEMSRKRK